MRVTVDTNLLVSASLWGGNPRRVLDAARDGIFELCLSGALLEELAGVLDRDKFRKRLIAVRSTPAKIVSEIEAIATVVEVERIEPVIFRDPDDDAVLACALSSQSKVIVSGDDDLLELKQYRGIWIITATRLLAELNLL